MTTPYPIPPEPRTRCIECGAKWECDADVPLLYNADTDEYYHGCPHCGTDAYLLDIPREPAAAARP